MSGGFAKTQLALNRSDVFCWLAGELWVTCSVPFRSVCSSAPAQPLISPPRPFRLPADVAYFILYSITRKGRAAARGALVPPPDLILLQVRSPVFTPAPARKRTLQLSPRTRSHSHLPNLRAQHTVSAAIGALCCRGGSLAAEGLVDRPRHPSPLASLAEPPPRRWMKQAHVLRGMLAPSRIWDIAEIGRAHV